MSELAPGFALEGDGVAGHALVAAGCPPLAISSIPRTRASAHYRRVVSPAGSPASIAGARAEERKTPQNPALATFRRASPRPRSDTTGRDWGRATATSGILGASGSDYGQFQHGCGLRSGLGAVRDGGGQSLQRPGSSAQARQARARGVRRGAADGRRCSTRAGAAADRTQARRRQCRGGQGDLPEAVLHLPHRRQGRRQQGRPQPVGHRRPQEGEPRGLQPTPRPCRPRAATGPTKTSTT